MMKKIALLVSLIVICFSCIEEVDLAVGAKGSIKPDILIVEGTLTNELKNHRVILTKVDTIIDLEIDSTYNPFIPSWDIDRDLVNYEENAQVEVVDGTGAIYTFNETSPGVYESISQFAAEQNNTYQLKVRTSAGKDISSKPMKIQGVSSIDNLYAEKTISDTGVEGIGIFIDNSSEAGNAQNLRYVYDETYKIIAPDWTPFEFKLSNYDPCALPVPTYDLEIVERTEEQQICYATEASNEIVQAQLSNIDDSSLERFMVRFLGKDNFMISHRYSIEVSQMVSSAEAYGFYDQLNNFSQTGNVFSQVQPGFLEGNLYADDGSLGVVMGFFDVVSVSKDRVFFNYTDFYPEEPLPPFPFVCGLHSSPESHVSYCFQGEAMNNCPQSIIERVNEGLIAFVGNNDLNIGTCPGPYIYVPSVCGDCTTLGSNVVPEFWEEE